MFCLYMSICVSYSSNSSELFSVTVVVVVNIVELSEKVCVDQSWCMARLRAPV